MSTFNVLYDLFSGGGMVYVIYHEVWDIRDIGDPLEFAGIEIKAIFRDAERAREWLEKYIGVPVKAEDLPEPGKCVDLPINLEVCNAESDL